MCQNTHIIILKKKMHMLCYHYFKVLHMLFYHYLKQMQCSFAFLQLPQHRHAPDVLFVLFLFVSNVCICFVLPLFQTIEHVVLSLFQASKPSTQRANRRVCMQAYSSYFKLFQYCRGLSISMTPLPAFLDFNISN